MNAFRQGRALGTYLIVGVNSDESITACKGMRTIRVLSDTILFIATLDHASNQPFAL